MLKYLLLYKSDASTRERMAQATADEAAAGMEAWMAWASRAGGAVVDLGSPVAPVDEAGDAVGGYSILQATDHEALEGVLEGHPHTAQGGTIEVYSFLPVPGM